MTFRAIFLGTCIPLLAILTAPAGANLPGQVVDVAASEYAFRSPDTIASGLTTFRLRQEGRVRSSAKLSPAGRDSLALHEGDPTDGLHMLWVVRLDSGKTAADLYAAERADVTTPWAHVIGGPGFAFPPQSTNATMLLEPGNYVLACYVGAARENRRRYHLLKGMFRALTVVPSSTPAAPMPDPDVVATFGAGDSVHFSRPITKAGSWKILVRNATGRRGVFGIKRLLAGHSAAESAAWRRSNGKPPVSEPWGGLAGVAAGDSMLTTIDFIPGTYASGGTVFVVER